MDFSEYKCPVCNMQFKQGEDIVVCPECGAPHHRGCYEALEHCYYEDKHSKDFSFENLNAKTVNNDSGEGTSVICPRCHTENPKEIFYCRQCGLPLSNGQNNAGNYNNSNNQQYRQQSSQQPNMQGNMPPYGTGFMFDPMAGIDNNEPIADNVTAGEMSKFIGKNTPYFLQIFNRIKKFSSSRYNFAAFLFTGMYFLYRKMIPLGIIFSILTIGLTVGPYFIYTLPAYQEAYNIVAQNIPSSIYSLLYMDTSILTTEQLLIYNLPMLLNMLLFVIRIVCGAIANRHYYKHCTKKINEIKSQDSAESLNQRLESKGGVNLALAVCVGVIFVAINYIPFFI